MSLNQQQFKVWHDQHRPRLLNRMTGVVRDREAAEEITATACATAFENLDRFRGESSLDTWVHAIAFNEARQCLGRRRKVRLESLETVESGQLEEPDTLADDFELSECRSKLGQALERVPKVYRRTLINHFVHGYPVKTMARQERVPVGTVLSRIFRAKRLLREAWAANTSERR